MPRNFSPAHYLNSVNLVVMQFNVLANSLCTTTSFPAVYHDALDNRNRSKLVVGEITEFMPDILCLQELDYFEDLCRWLKPFGYKGVFKCKKGDHTDGCAIFYKSALFSFDPRVDDLSFDLKDSSQVACMIRLIHKNPSVDYPTVVVSAHLKAKPGFEDVRTKQMTEIREKMDECTSDFDQQFLCGDFNAVPTETCYKIASKLLYDAYAPDGWYSEDDYTTFKYRRSRDGEIRAVKRVSDYIFHNDNATCTNIVKGFPNPEGTFPEGLPSVSYPSDHLALVAHFTIATN